MFPVPHVSGMQRRTIVVGAVAALLVVAGVAAAFGGGFLGTSDAPSDESSEVSSFPTETATPSGGSASDGGSDANSTPEPAPAFAFAVERIERCGQTCRDVTSSVTNDGTEAATGVTVYSRIFVGNSTAEEDLAWQGKEPVGSLDAGETHTATKRVELSYSEALAVKSAGGWVTVQTTVQSDEKTVTFTERRKVA